ncbi:MAG: metallophosphoesterase [Lachnospiraceae bacterium]|nr:metallophosphoesterase [Lachnospiraceae bacterium]
MKFRKCMGMLLATALGAGLLTGCGKEAAWEKTIAEEYVYVEGMEGEYTLLFLTDTHVVIQSEDASEQEKQNQQERYPMFFNKEGVSSAEQFPEWISYANKNKVDGVLLGGDIIDTPSDANIAWLDEQLEQLKMPYLYVNGNHDWTFPWEYMTPTGRETYLPLLEPYMNGNTAVQTLDFEEFTIVGIDNSTNQVDGSVLPVYEELLSREKPLIVLGHVPFMTQSVLGRAKEVWSSPVVIGAGNYGGIYPDENSQRFVALTTGENSSVELVLAGHVHFYDRDVIEGEKDVLQVVGGAGYEGNAVLLHISGKKQ